MARVLYLAILAFVAAYIIQYYRVKRCSITRETADNEYDFVIVGAGTSGSVIANRLSEIHNVKILLLEAGEEDSPNFLINTPMMVTTLQNASTDWSYRTVPQKHACFSLKDKVSFWPRGKVLGGSSSINYM
uniref:Glucose-methanol-choline oxidoreductase N-terminal domain-containing protein n=1 Tax=Ciona savignyi TaxID=51511 RepID=H2ZC62_CIOSA